MVVNCFNNVWKATYAPEEIDMINVQWNLLNTALGRWEQCEVSHSLYPINFSPKVVQWAFDSVGVATLKSC